MRKERVNDHKLSSLVSLVPRFGLSIVVLEVRVELCCWELVKCRVITPLRIISAGFTRKEE